MNVGHWVQVSGNQPSKLLIANIKIRLSGNYIYTNDFGLIQCYVCPCSNSDCTGGEVIPAIRSKQIREFQVSVFMGSPPPPQTGSYLYLSGLSLENRTYFKYLRIKEFNVRIRTYMNFGRAGRWGRGVKGKGVKVLEIYRFKVIEIYRFEAPKLLIRKLLQFLGDFFLPIVY